MKIVHLTWATEGRQPAFPAEEARRRVLRALASVAGGAIVLFAVVDDHVHLVLSLPPSPLHRLQASITKVLNHRSAVRFSPPFLRPVVTRTHLESLVGYCLNQTRHHGLAEDPAMATGSCFADLIGARRIPGLALPLPAVLPRFQMATAFAAVDLPVDLQAADAGALRHLGAARLAEVVAETLCVGPGFSGNAARVAEARRVAARLAIDVGFRPRDIAEPLEVTPIAVARLANRPVEEADLRSVRKRVALLAAVSGRRLSPELVRERPPLAYRVGESVGESVGLA